MGQLYDSWLASQGIQSGVPNGTIERDPATVRMYNELVRTIGRYRSAGGQRMARREIEMLQSQVDIAELNRNITSDLMNMEERDADSVRNAIVDYRTAIMNNRTELVNQRRQFNDSLMQQVMTERSRSPDDPDAAAWRALTGSIFQSPEGTAADVELPSLLRRMQLEGVGLVTWDDNFIIQTNELEGDLRTRVVRLLDTARYVQQNRSDAERALNNALDGVDEDGDGEISAEERRNTLGDPLLLNDASWSSLDQEARDELINNARNNISTISNNIRDSDGVQDFRSSQDTLNEVMNADAAYQRYEQDYDRLRTELFGTSAGEDEIIGRALQALQDSGWAESNGFDNIGGFVDTTGDGTPDTYSRGTNDTRALLAWRRQQMAGPGRGYGIRGASTDMWVELEVALSPDQVEQYRTDSGFAYREVDGERVWMTSNELNRELSARPVTAYYLDDPIEFTRIGADIVAPEDGASVTTIEAGGGVFQDSRGNFFRIADSGDHFIELSLDPDVHATLLNAVETLDPYVIGAHYGESSQPAYDEDLITSPNEHTNIVGIANGTGDVGALLDSGRNAPPDAEQYADLVENSPQQRAIVLGIEYADEADFTENRTHRIVGRLDRQHASVDRQFGPGSVTVGGRIFSPEQIRSSRVIRRDSETTMRNVIHQMRTTRIADVLGFGTSGVPTTPVVIRQGSTVFTDESGIRGNVYDSISDQVGNIPERPTLASLRDRLFPQREDPDEQTRLNDILARAQRGERPSLAERAFLREVSAVTLPPVVGEVEAEVPPTTVAPEEPPPETAPVAPTEPEAPQPEVVSDEDRIEAEEGEAEAQPPIETPTTPAPEVEPESEFSPIGIPYNPDRTVSARNTEERERILAQGGLFTGVELQSFPQQYPYLLPGDPDYDALTQYYADRGRNPDIDFMPAWTDDDENSYQEMRDRWQNYPRTMRERITDRLAERRERRAERQEERQEELEAAPTDDAPTRPLPLPTDYPGMEVEPAPEPEETPSIPQPLPQDAGILGADPEMLEQMRSTATGLTEEAVPAETPTPRFPLPTAGILGADPEILKEMQDTSTGLEPLPEAEEFDLEGADDDKRRVLDLLSRRRRKRNPPGNSVEVPTAEGR